MNNKMDIKDYLEGFKAFCSEMEDLEIKETPFIKLAFRKTRILTQSLEQYLQCDEFCELVNNLWLHYVIVNSDTNSPLYNKYDVGGSSVLVTSTSAGGSSASMEVPRTITEGDLFTYDLYRTPYGRFALIILESLKNIAIVRL